MGSFALHEGFESRRAYSPASEIRLYKSVAVQSHLKSKEHVHRPQEVPLHKNHPLKVQTDRLDGMRFTGAWLEAPL